MIKKFFGLMIFATVILFSQSAFAEPYLTYQAHVQDRGWLRPVGSGDVAGTTGHNRRLEAIIINLPEGVEYRAHVQDIGWQRWRSSGEVAGTVGENRRMEAIRIRLVRKGDDYDYARDRYDRYDRDRYDRYNRDRYDRERYDDYEW